VCRVPACGYGNRDKHPPAEVEMADQSQDPEHPDPKPGEAGFGPGEEGDSIEEGREGGQADDDKDDSDS